MEETLQHETTTQRFGLPTTGPGNHRPDGPKACHALTIKLDHSSGAGHHRRRRFIQPVEASRRLWRNSHTVRDRSLRNAIDGNSKQRIARPRRSSFPPLCSTTTGRGRSTPHRCQGRVSGSQPRRPPAPTASVGPKTSDYPHRVIPDRHRVPLFNTEITPGCAGHPNGAAAIHLKLTPIAMRPAVGHEKRGT